jgi:tyrosine-protein phosphatase SIW14
MQAKEVTPKIWRGSRPELWDDFARLRALGIKTILCLEGGVIERLTNDIANECNEFGGAVNWVPLSTIFPPTKHQVQTALSIMKTVQAPIYVHCKEGRDRTGFMIALYEVLFCNYSVDAAIAEMHGNGFHWWYWYWIPTLRKLCIELKGWTVRND